MARKISNHKSFKRSYREDYVRELEIPGMMHHILATFRAIFRNIKILLPLVLIVSVAGVLLIEGLSDTSVVFVLFVVLWLATIFVLRQEMAGHKVGLRDALYNSMTPFVSVFVVFMVALLECLPIFIVIIAYSTALETKFFDLPFYALLFLVVAGLLLLLSAYLLSSTLIALVAVSAPGIYPLKALRISSELMMSRRVRFVLRLVALVLLLGVFWAIIMAPFVVFGFVPVFTTVCIVVLAGFSCVYATAYLYLYYRWMLGYDTKEVKNDKKRS